MENGATFANTEQLVVGNDFPAEDVAPNGVVEVEVPLNDVLDTNLAPESFVTWNTTDLPPASLDTDRRVVALVGFAGSSREKVNDEPENVEVWGLNNGYTFMKRKPSLWFDIHRYDGRDEFREKHWNTMIEMDVPVLALHPPVPLPENVSRINYTGICERLGAKEYFTNSVAYMIAYAIDQDVDELRLYGIDMATGTEFAHQRACCEYWLGIAVGRGIKVHIAEESPILRGLQYGVDRDDGFGKGMILDQMSQLKNEHQTALSDVHFTRGRVNMVEDLTKAFSDYELDNDTIGVEDIRGIMAEMYKFAKEQAQEKENQFHTTNGALQGTRLLMNRLFLPEMSHNELDLASDQMDASQGASQNQVPEPVGMED